MQLIHDFLKGHILVRIGPQCHLPHAAKQLQEGRIPSQIGPQRQLIYKKSNQPFNLDPIAVGNWTSYHHILLSCPAS